jgi:hypothetical protein
MKDDLAGLLNGFGDGGSLVAIDRRQCQDRLDRGAHGFRHRLNAGDIRLVFVGDGVFEARRIRRRRWLAEYRLPAYRGPRSTHGGADCCLGGRLAGMLLGPVM